MLSDIVALEAGVAQGAILSLHLIIVYMNDIVDVTAAGLIEHFRHQKNLKKGDSGPNSNGTVLFLACGVEIKFLVIIFGRKNGIA